MSDLIKVHTESGAVYEFKPWFVRRVSFDHEMRRDGHWLRVFAKDPIRIGEPMVIWLEPLDPEAVITQRFTTPVVSIEQV